MERPIDRRKTCPSLVQIFPPSLNQPKLRKFGRKKRHFFRGDSTQNAPYIGSGIIFKSRKTPFHFKVFAERENEKIIEIPLHGTPRRIVFKFYKSHDRLRTRFNSRHT